jgi:glycosyltransferase involved in cell wall biosynthesis
MMDCAALWVVVPAYNEGLVIGAVVGELRAAGRNVVVVDDCSSDGTGAAAAAAGARVLRHPVNLGQGAALQTGIRYALMQEADCIVTFDADGQHRAEDIAVMIETQAATGADVVLGSRFLGRTENMPPLRRVVLKLAALFTRLTSGIAVTDAHNGLRLLTRRAAARIRITQDRMAHASEIADQIGSLGLSVAEAPVTIVYTEYSLHKGQTLANAFNILAELIAARISK